MEKTVEDARLAIISLTEKETKTVMDISKLGVVNLRKFIDTLNADESILPDFKQDVIEKTKFKIVELTNLIDRLGKMLSTFNQRGSGVYLNENMFYNQN